jgi:hypothetical protein
MRFVCNNIAGQWSIACVQRESMKSDVRLSGLNCVASIGRLDIKMVSKLGIMKC